MKTWIRKCLWAVLVGMLTVSWAEAEVKVWEEGILVLADSPVFDGFLFDHHAQSLTVYFCSGEVMEYRDVSCAAYQQLMNAEDRVTWFSNRIYRAFPCRRIASAFRPLTQTTQPHTTKETHYAVRQSSHSRR